MKSQTNSHLKNQDDAIASRNSLFGIVHLPSTPRLDNANYKNIVPTFPNNVNIKKLAQVVSRDTDSLQNTW